MDPDATGEIGEIVVEGNTKTTSETVTYIAKIGVGDTWSRELVEPTRVLLVSSGLFKDVELYTERKLDGKVRLHLLVKDKHSWVIAPAFYNQPTNVGGGVGFGENNLLGTGQKLLLYGQVATGDSFFIGAWQLPQISGSHFHAQFDTYLARSRIFEYATATSYLASPKAVRESRMIYLNGGAKVGIDLFLGLKFDVRLRGARVSYDRVGLAKDAMITDVDPGADPNAPPGPIAKPGKEGWDVSNEYDLIIDHRANWYGVQTGYKYTASFERSVPSLGSDFHYWSTTVSLFRAKQILERHNLIWKFNASYGHHLPFEQEDMMGGTAMRGWINNQFRGNVKVLSNLEYSLPLVSAYGLSIRGLGFWDSGYVAFTDTDNPDRNYLPDAGRLGLAPFKNSIGVGTRFYLRQVVLPLLGLDIGFGLEARDVHVYLAIGLTD
jgi:outer membrane protein assembly factor BamA